jgi:hypothetical protein
MSGNSNGGWHNDSLLGLVALVLVCALIVFFLNNTGIIHLW